MSDTQQTRSQVSEEPYPVQVRSERTGWVGFVYFAAIMLVMLGGFGAMEGLVAIFKDDYYLVTRNGLMVSIDFTTWGWVHLAIGLVAIAAGIGVFLGQMWARVVGVIVAVFSAFVNLAFLSAQPVWATIVIALDVLTIYALTVHGREVAS
jgi:hypothetical protein